MQWTAAQLLAQTEELANEATVRVQFGTGPLQLVERLRLIENRPFGGGLVWSVGLYTERETKRARPFTLSILRQLTSSRGLSLLVRTPDGDGKVQGCSFLRAENVLVLHCVEKLL